MRYDIDPKTGLIRATPEELIKFGDIIRNSAGNRRTGHDPGRDAYLNRMRSFIHGLMDNDYSIPDPTILSPAPVDLEESLLLEPPNQKDGCANAVEREYSWVRTIFFDIQAAIDQTWPMLNHIASICQAAKIYRCKDPECQRRQEEFQSILPHCEWPAFREWIIEISSCQMRVPPSERFTSSFIHLSCAVISFNWFLEGIRLLRYTNVASRYIKIGGEEADIDFFPICEIIYWGVIFQMYLGNSGFGHTVWGNTMIPHGVVAPKLAEVTRKAREKGICLNRLWNVSLISDRGEHDLPAIMDLTERYPSLRHRDHDLCTPGFCGFNLVDATKVRQLHKCETKGPFESSKTYCEENKLFFDPKLLHISVERGGGTIWSIDEPFEVLDTDVRYVTISHVWSDGTGVGIEPAGLVNRCLFNYFARLVKMLDCNAIWWDSISIPMDPDLRAKCINDMHKNYSRSTYTLVHDSYLADFEWAEDGSPALALVLSPWFTRGWTAVECNMADRIKVVYRKPGSHEPIIKDLDDDILAKDPTRCSRAHWIVSNIIRRLRDPIDNTSDLLAILKPRSTSWPRDRIMIAGLLAGIEVQYWMSAKDITQTIMKKIKNIDHSSLLHTEASICESGGWSWCPNYLYDLPASPPGEFKRALRFGRTCAVDINGTLIGEFPARRVNREDILSRRVVPTSSHPFVRSRIQAALEEWQNCLLIGHYPGPYVLVQTELPNDNYYSNVNYVPSEIQGMGVLCCTYLGTVITAGDDEMYTTEKYDPLVLNPIMIGRQPDVSFDFKLWLKFPSQRDLVIVGSIQTPLSSTLKWNFSVDHVWMGDNEIHGDLLVLRKNKVPHPTFGAEHMVMARSIHNIEVQEVGPGNFEIRVKEDPCFSLNPGNYIDKVSKWWSREVPNFSYVDTSPYWPPLTIPSDERTTRPNHTRHLQDSDRIVYSELLFRLDFVSTTVSYAAIDNALTEASEATPFVGIWACIYPDGQYEFHLLRYVSAGETHAIKITSINKDIPRGCDVIEFHSELTTTPDPDGGASLAQIKQFFRSGK
ncbi:hypothetical protein TWF281_002300 [Arthrobotrys megalospora]